MVTLHYINKILKRPSRENPFNFRHIDCSTQFFVLLQPAPWMDKKYVAFGQLVDGEETLKEIEAVSITSRPLNSHVHINCSQSTVHARKSRHWLPQRFPV